MEENVTTQGVQPLKTKCDGKCETCLNAWQMQCAARFGYKNNITQKTIENRIGAIEEMLSTILNKVNNPFGSNDNIASPITEEDKMEMDSSIPTQSTI